MPTAVASSLLKLLANSMTTIFKYSMPINQKERGETIKQKLIDMGWTPPLDDVNRVEVIDHTGRAYTHYLKPGEKVTISMQDDNTTMKIFIGDS